MVADGDRGRIRDFGIVIGTTPTGPVNAITDVPGVRVGMRTVVRGSHPDDGPVVRSGVTAVFPHAGDLFRERVYAAVSVFNGYGEVTSNIVIDEWGMIGSPVVITDTTHIGLGYDSVSRWMAARDPVVGTLDVVIPVVAESDDGFLNDNRAFGLAREDFFAALDAATDGPVAEGSVASAVGTQQFDFKGGIGTSSRVLDLKGERFTVGVLVNTNYANRHQLQILGVPVGRLVTDLMPSTHHEGSCIAVVATDAPLHPRQLRRLARRVDVGLARTGSVGNDGSGEIFIAFSTANRIPRETPRLGHPVEVLAEGQFWTQGSPIDRLFEAVADATEEAALNALFQATTVVGRDGNVLHALPIARTLDCLRSWRVL